LGFLSMTEKELDTIRERYLETPNLNKMIFPTDHGLKLAEHAIKDIPALLDEVKRLRGLFDCHKELTDQYEGMLRGALFALEKMETSNE